MNDPDATIFCLGCGYNLRGLSSRTCPECGRDFDPENPDTFSRSADGRRLSLSGIAKKPKEYPILWLSGTAAYCLIVAPFFLTKSRPGGPLISVLGELTPFILSLTGIVGGMMSLRRQTALGKLATFAMILLGTAIIGLVIVNVISTYEFTGFRLSIFGP